MGLQVCLLVRPLGDVNTLASSEAAAPWGPTPSASTIPSSATPVCPTAPSIPTRQHWGRAAHVGALRHAGEAIHTQAPVSTAGGRIRAWGSHARQGWCLGHGVAAVPAAPHVDHIAGQAGKASRASEVSACQGSLSTGDCTIVSQCWPVKSLHARHHSATGECTTVRRPCLQTMHHSVFSNQLYMIQLQKPTSAPL